MTQPTLILGSDHAGLHLKNHLLKWLQGQRFQVQDLGVFTPESMDYPDIAEQLARAVVATPDSLGILVCGSGIGVCIAANKIQGARAALCHDPVSAGLSREHNNANILTLGERIITPLLAETVVSAWLAAEFAGGRHQQRVEKITHLENT